MQVGLGVKVYLVGPGVNVNRSKQNDKHHTYQFYAAYLR